MRLVPTMKMMVMMISYKYLYRADCCVEMFSNSSIVGLKNVFFVFSSVLSCRFCSKEIIFFFLALNHNYYSLAVVLDAS